MILDYLEGESDETPDICLSAYTHIIPLPDNSFEHQNAQNCYSMQQVLCYIRIEIAKHITRDSEKN